MDSNDKKFELAMAEVLADAGYAETEIKSNEKIVRVKAYGGYFGILMMFAMMGFYSIISTLNSGDWLKGVLVEEVLTKTVIMIMCSFIAWLLCICFEFDEYNLKVFLGVGIVLMMLVYVDSKYLYNSISDYWVSGEYHWGYEVVILPLNAFYILKLCESIEREWSVKNNMLAFLSFASWQLFLWHLSSQLYMSYQGSLVVTNAIIFGGILLTAKKEKRHWGNRIAALGLYVGTMLMALYLKKDRTMSLGDYLFDQPGFSGYVAAVKKLFANTKWFGAAYDGISAEMELLRNSSNPIHSLCAYWGMLPVLIYCVLLILIMIIFGKTVYQYRKKDNNRLFFAVGLAAYANLSMRFILGTMHSLISPLQVEMMYMGPNRIFDYCSSAILLMMYFKHKEEQGYTGPFEQVKNDLFKKIVEFYVLEEEEWEDFEDEEFDKLDV